MRSRDTRTPGPAARGFTLIELMLTMTILAVVLGIGVPKLTRLMTSNRIATQTNTLVASLQLARSEAVRRAQAVSLRAKDDASHEYAAGWSVFTDVNEDGAAADSAQDGEVVRDQAAATGPVTVKRVTRSAPPGPFTYTADTSDDADFLVFNSRGANVAGTPAFFRICDSVDTAVPGRVVQVSPVGRISLDDTRASC